MAKRPTYAELEQDIVQLEAELEHYVRELRTLRAVHTQLQAMYDRMLEVMAMAASTPPTAPMYLLQQPVPDLKAKDRWSSGVAQPSPEPSTSQLVETALETLNECMGRYAFRSQYGAPWDQTAGTIFSNQQAAPAVLPDNVGSALASYMREHPMETEEEARRALGLGGEPGSGGA